MVEEVDVLLIPTVRKQDRVYEQVRHWIVNGVLAPGEQLGQDEIAARLGVSRAPLRAALSRLAADGLVVDRPHQSWVVAAVSAADARDVYHGRSSLEAMLAAAAALAVSTQVVSAPALTALAALLHDQEAAARAGDFTRFRSIDRRFHAGIYALAEMPRSLHAQEQLRSLCDRYVTSYLSDDQRARNSLSEHHAILDALRAGDVERTTTLTREHVLTGLSALSGLPVTAWPVAGGQVSAP